MPLSVDRGRHRGSSRKTRLSAEYRAASRVTLAGMVLDLLLAGGKSVTGLLFHSQALLVDGIHSFTDAFSDLMVLAIMKFARREPDQNHPYGHQRFETFGAMLLGSLLIGVGAALAWDNLQRVVGAGELRTPSWPVLAVALLSVAGKEWIFHYTRRVGRRIHSDLILANAWHSRTDALSSVVVLVASVGAMVGYPWLDALAAVVIAIIIARVGWKFAWDSVRELVDTGLSPADVRTLADVARATEGVRNVHDLRSRRMGHDILVEVHLQVNPDISVSEGHQIGMQVVHGMREAMPRVTHINFHIDAEYDADGPPTTERLPSRRQVRQALARRLPELGPEPRLRLHYLGNKVHLELFLEQSHPVALNAKVLEDELADLPWVGSVRVWYPGP